MYIQIYMFWNVRVYVYSYIHICTFMYIYIYIYIHTHTHTYRIQSWALGGAKSTWCKIPWNSRNFIVKIVFATEVSMALFVAVKILTSQLASKLIIEKNYTSDFWEIPQSQSIRGGNNYSALWRKSLTKGRSFPSRKKEALFYLEKGGSFSLSKKRKALFQKCRISWGFIRSHVSQCVVLCCRMLPCVAVCCSVLQCERMS